MLWVNLIVLVVAVIALIKSADVVVKTLTRLAIYFKLSEFVIGFIVLAIATSIPELFVAIASATAKIPALALGDVLGANIVNLTLIVGVILIISKSIKVKSEIAKKDILYMIILVILPLVLMLDKVLSRIDGVVLITVFGLYLFRILNQGKSFRKVIDHTSKKEAIADAVLLVLAIAVLLVAVRTIVQFASLLATEAGIPPFLIGVLMLAIGTSLPELSSAVMATVSHLQDMAIGDIFGSVVVNSTLVLGIAALIHPITTEFTLLLISAIFMIFSLLFVAYLTRVKDEIGWRAGVFLIILYILFIMIAVGTKLSGHLF